MADNRGEKKRPDSSMSKEEALERALGLIEKSYGLGSIMKLADDQVKGVEGIPTGSLTLDIALGGLGLPRGRIIEIFGPESSGKTTIALHTIANAQKAGGVGALIDAEHAFDRSWARKLGVDVNALLLSQPDSGEMALDICETLVHSNAVDVIVVDSVAALVPRAEIEGDIGDSHVALQARLMSQALRKLTSAIAKSSCVVIFINQLRDKPGVSYGPSETTPGGRALKFFSSVRLDIRRTQMIKGPGDETIGSAVKAKVVKNKVAPPFRQAEFEILFNCGISQEGEIIDQGAQCGVIQKSGAWFSWGDTRLGQGREAVRQLFRDNPEMMMQVRNEILRATGVVLPGDVPVAPIDEDADGEDAKDEDAKPEKGRKKKGKG